MYLNSGIIVRADAWLDHGAFPDYQFMSLAQDWARVAKISEEHGEAIAQLILATGQNPRKGKVPEAFERMLAELGDVALTAILAIQHFTKDADETEQVLHAAMEKLESRIPDS